MTGRRSLFPLCPNLMVCGYHSSSRGFRPCPSGVPIRCRAPRRACPLAHARRSRSVRRRSRSVCRCRRATGRRRPRPPEGGERRGRRWERGRAGRAPDEYVGPCGLRGGWGSWLSQYLFCTFRQYSQGGTRIEGVPPPTPVLPGGGANTVGNGTRTPPHREIFLLILRVKAGTFLALSPGVKEENAMRHISRLRYLGWLPMAAWPKTCGNGSRPEGSNGKCRYEGGVYGGGMVRGYGGALNARPPYPRRSPWIKIG